LKSQRFLGSVSECREGADGVTVGRPARALPTSRADIGDRERPGALASDCLAVAAALTYGP